MPALQSAIKMLPINPQKYVADNRLAGNSVVIALAAATQPLSGALGKLLGPSPHGFVTARATQVSTGGDGQHGAQRMTTAGESARIVGVLEKLRQRSHLPHP